MDSSPVAIVTGASSGIGLATAHRLATAGYRLCLAARTEAALADAAATLPGEPLTVATDIGALDQVDRLVDAAIDRFGRIDVLVNNAGFAPLKPIDETDAETLRTAFMVNAVGPAHAISRCWPHLGTHGQGCVINVSTMGTDDPFPGFFAYAASKASVNLMARSCANEGADRGIRAFSIAPGAVETPMLRGLFDTAQLPADACLAPDDVAALIVACIQGDHDDRNGDTIFISR